jgi:hypothetical protein
LVRRFGFQKFQEAVEAVSFSPSSGGVDEDGYWRKNSFLDMRDKDVETNFSSTEQLFLEQGLNAKGMESVVVSIGQEPDDWGKREIIRAMKFSHDRRLKWIDYYGTSQSWSRGRWKKLQVYTLRNRNEDDEADEVDEDDARQDF